jgi:phage gpG-like protein
MRFRIEVEGKEQLLSSFLKVEHGLLDLRQLGAWRLIKTVFHRLLKRIFDSEGSDSAHGKWQQISPKYAVVKQRKYGDMPILQAGGKMYRALTGNTGDTVFEESAQEMAIGTSAKSKSGFPYPKAHQTGTSRMPARPPISFTREQQKELTDPLVLKLRQLIANAKLAERRGF